MEERGESLPKLGQKLLGRICSASEQEALEGDFAELYRYRLKSKGKAAAVLWYWLQIFRLLPGLFKDSFIWGTLMLKNYFKVTLRNIRQHKGYALINVAGLAIGMACFILILLFVGFELSFDGYHEKADQIYRIVLERLHSGESFFMAPTMLPLAPALNANLPDISHAVRVSQRRSELISSEEKYFYERLYYGDADLFEVFSFPLLKGEPDTVLSEPFSMVITERVAEKYFGSQDPLGKTLKINNKQDYKITGILAEIPANSHFRFHLMASFSSLNNTERVKRNSWTSFSNDYTYICLPAGVDKAALQGKIQALVNSSADLEDDDRYITHLQALQDIHFSDLNYDFARTYNRSYLYAFSAVGFFILLIACINFMNLATARSGRRAREVGLRKVVGAYRSQLIKQFFTESVVMALIALAASVLLVYLILPQFNRFINRVLVFDLFKEPGLLFALLGLTLFTGILAGCYPALYLSSFQPIKVLKSKTGGSVKRFSFRTVFVVVQFAISIFLIISTLVVFNQLDYMKSKDLGFDQEQVLVIPLQASPIKEDLEAFKAQIRQNPMVLNASSANGTPASGSSSASNYHVDGPDGPKEIYLKTIYTDYDFAATFELEVVEGRYFSREFATDAGQAYLLNETAVRALGLESALGKKITVGDDTGFVIGMVRDFHYDSTQYQIVPMALNINPEEYNYISVKISPQNITRTLAFLEDQWQRFSPGFPFEHFFIDEEFESYYRFEQRLVTLFIYFSALAIFISCLGVFGLIAFTAEQSTKEIGIRKILGASVSGIIFLLSRQFIKWILIANLIAWPTAWLVMSGWLQNFAYRVGIKLWIFPLAGLMALTIALVTTSYQSIKAATANPVDSLRYE